MRPKWPIASPMCRLPVVHSWNGWREKRFPASKFSKARRNQAMTDTLEETAAAMVAEGKGILAADESTGTIKKRFDQIGVESTADLRRDYREMLFRSAEAMSKYISGVIL